MDNNIELTLYNIYSYCVCTHDEILSLLYGCMYNNLFLQRTSDVNQIELRSSIASSIIL